MQIIHLISLAMLAFAPQSPQTNKISNETLKSMAPIASAKDSTRYPRMAKPSAKEVLSDKDVNILIESAQKLGNTAVKGGVIGSVATFYPGQLWLTTVPTWCSYAFTNYQSPSFVAEYGVYFEDTIGRPADRGILVGIDNLHADMVLVEATFDTGHGASDHVVLNAQANAGAMTSQSFGPGSGQTAVFLLSRAESSESTRMMIRVMSGACRVRTVSIRPIG